MVPNVSDPSEAKSAVVPLSADFCADNADVVIRAAGTLDFRAHKCILSLVSPIFKDMFTIPQPPIDTPDTLPHVDVDESAGTWENILRTIYPVPHPIIDDLDDLESLLLAAKKYEMQPLIDVHKNGLENPTFVKKEPLRLYAIACACGLEDQAKYIARNSELLMVAGHPDAENLEGITVASYHRLVSFITKRDNEWRQLLGYTPIPTYGIHCDCDSKLKGELYGKIKEELKVLPFRSEEVYLKTVENRLRSQMACGRGGCVTDGSAIKLFIEKMAEERKKLFDKLMCDKQYVQWPLTALPPPMSLS